MKSWNPHSMLHHVRLIAGMSCGGPEAFTSTTIVRKCGIKTSREDRNATS